MLKPQRFAREWVIDKYHWIESCPPIPYECVPRDWCLWDGAHYYCAIECSDPLCGCELGRIADDEGRMSAECVRCGEPAEDRFVDPCKTREDARAWLMGIVAAEIFRVPFWDTTDLQSHLFGS